MTYLFLLCAIFAEVAATSLLKSTEGFTRLWPTVICLVGYAVSFALLALSISRGMQTDVAYALWSAIGTAAIVLIAVLFLGSPVIRGEGRRRRADHCRRGHVEPGRRALAASRENSPRIRRGNERTLFSDIH